MSDTRRVKSDLIRGEDVMSIAAVEAFEYLNAGTKLHYRGAGDTPTAARGRAAEDAGITRAQAERIWKRWRNMASCDGDVYRLLRNSYGHLCEKIEASADEMRARRLNLKEQKNAVDQSPMAMGAGMVGASKGAEPEMTGPVAAS